MHPRTLLAAALLLLAPLALAQGALPPHGSVVIDAGEHDVTHWIGPQPDFVPGNATFTSRAGEPIVLWFAMQGARPNATLVASIQMASETLGLTERSTRLHVPANETGWVYANLTATTPLAPTNATYVATIQVSAEEENTTTILANATYVGTIVLEAAPAPIPPGGIPTAWIVWGAAAVVVAAGGASAYAMRQRAIRRRMQGARRSQVMREMELEEKLQRAKDPEVVQEIQQEIRAQEAVRVERRELQILEAKRADALKTLDLLQKRHESGGLTKLQYDNMVAKKRADLERIEAEIESLGNSDAPQGS